MPRAVIPSLVLVLAGCPWVFGPPDLSNVPGPTIPDPTGSTGSTGSTGHTGAPTPTGHTGTPEPGVLEVVAVPTSVGIALLMQAPDPDARTELGGTVRIGDGVDELSLALPDDLLRWDPLGQSIAIWPRVDPCASIDTTLSVAVLDAAGAPVSQGSAPALLNGLGRHDESGEPMDLPDLQFPGAVCGSLTFTESDLVRFFAPVGGRWTLTATWDNNADVDLMLYDDYGTPLNGSQGITQPETMSFDFVEGGVYVLEVLHFSGPAVSTWAVLFELEP